jgi:hypothetical protein
MVVLAISMVLAIGIGTVITYLAAAEKSSGRQRLNREAYYVCDGVGRIISKTTSEVLADSRFSTGSAAADLEDVVMDEVEAIHGPRLETLLGDLRQPYEIDGPDGFIYRDVDVNTSFGQVGVGRFAGLNGQRRTFTYDLALRRVFIDELGGRSDGGSTCTTTATVDTVRVPLSEFAFFSTEDVRLCPSWSSTDVTRVTRYHVNGDLVVGEHALPRTTVTGTITPGCGAALIRACTSSGGCFRIGGGAAISDAADSTTLGARAIAALLADGKRGTSTLKFPQSIVRVQTSDFADVGGVSDLGAVKNDGSLRYLVDPVDPAGDDGAADSNRLASLAQIRILDGVWYINDGSWPGVPVWSDHPDSFVIQTSESPDEHALVGDNTQVGQQNLYPGGATIPGRYSHYGSATIAPSNGRPVVSYGSVVRSDGRWTPGPDPLTTARTGFGDVHTARQTHTGDPGRVLPINIDLEALHAALDAPGENELRDRLLAVAPTTDFSRIIVWVSSTWDGSLKGLRTSDTRPDPRPRFTSCSGTMCATAVDVAKSPLPYAMCQNGAAAGTARSCQEAADRRVTAVRVMNGVADLGSRLITIATPLPLYVLGSMDRGTGTDAAAPVGMPGLGQTVLAASNTPSLFFAADTVTLLSDHWNEDVATWATPALVTRTPAELLLPPVVNASILTGRYIMRSPSQTPYGGERAVRFLEGWPTASVSTSPIVTGSIHIGFRAVHQTAAACYGDATDASCATAAPWRHYWSEALAAETMAPPGMPAFVLRGVGETVPDSMQLNLTALLEMLRRPRSF